MSAQVYAPPEAQVTAVVDRFNAAWNSHDLPAALALISDD